jgi:hypothetical protein
MPHTIINNTHLTFSEDMKLITQNTVTHVNLPNGVTTISYGTFECRTWLNTVIFPDGLTTIDSSAFKDCTGLTHITLPDGLTTFIENLPPTTSTFPSITLKEYYCEGLQDETLGLNTGIIPALSAETLLATPKSLTYRCEDSMQSHCDIRNTFFAGISLRKDKQDSKPLPKTWLTHSQKTPAPIQQTTC